MDITRKGMGITQQPKQPAPAPVPVAERLSNALIRPRKPIAELSSEKLGQYKKAAGAQASAADKAGDTKKANKRFSGIVKATKKQFDNDAKGVGEDHSTVGGWGKGAYDTYSGTRHGRGVAEKMLPKSAFAGSDKNKLGPAGQWKNTGPSKNRPARAGDLVGGAEESIEREEKQRLDPKCWKGYRKAGTKMKGGVRVNNCVPVSEDVENILATLIDKIIVNEAIQNNKRGS